MKLPWRGRTVSCAWWDDHGIYRKTIRLFGIQRYIVSICLSAPGARSFLPIYLKKTELAIAGRSNTQIEDAIIDGIAKGELPTPEPGSVSFMMSKQGYLNAGVKGPWLPHVMFFVPEIDPKALGSDLGDDVPLDAHEEKIGRYTTIDVPVSKWSDGTPADSRDHAH